jgi:hypothetical protein
MARIHIGRIAIRVRGSVADAHALARRIGPELAERLRTSAPPDAGPRQIDPLPVSAPSADRVSAAIADRVQGKDRK